MKVRRKNECNFSDDCDIRSHLWSLLIFIDHSDEKSALAINIGAFYPPKIEYKQEYWLLFNS